MPEVEEYSRVRVREERIEEVARNGCRDEAGCFLSYVAKQMRSCQWCGMMLTGLNGVVVG